MDKKQKEEQTRFFADAFEEVVVPVLDEMKNDITGIKDEMATKDDIDRLEVRLTKKDDHLERHDKKLDSHGKRITKLETKTGLAA